MLTTLYLENFVKGMAKTTAGVVVLFVSYPLFLMYDSYLRDTKQRSSSDYCTFTKLDDLEDVTLSERVKSSLDKLV
jgi:hypothetical protein